MIRYLRVDTYVNPTAMNLLNMGIAIVDVFHARQFQDIRENYPNLPYARYLQFKKILPEYENLFTGRI